MGSVEAVRAQQRAAVGLFVPDPAQAAVIDLPDEASAAVLGAPGTGKTTTLVELVAGRVLERGWRPEQVLALAATRASATRLRDRLALRLRVPTTGPIARTSASFAFELVRDAARDAGTHPPRLVTGGEQDADIAALLHGHLEDGTGPAWPPTLGPEVRRTRQFRTQLRELMMRVTDLGVGPAGLRRLAADRERPEWAAAADFIAEYTEVVSSAREHQFDASELAAFAVRAIETGTAGSLVDDLRLVVVDDLQEATQATLSMLRSLARRGVAIIAFGDPDVAANAFRGGRADALGSLATVLGVPVDRVQTALLTTVHRQGPALRGLTSAITERIGTALASAQRAAAVAGADDDRMPVARIEAVTAARAWAGVARALRERHVLDGVAWNQLAVIVRSGASIPAVTRALALAEVPTRVVSGGRALRDDGAARSLLAVVDAGIGRAELTAATATDLLLGPFGGLDRIGLRRLRLALRTEELAGGGDRTADELLVEALGDAARLTTIEHRTAHTAARLATTLAMLRDSHGSIEELLWLVWERSGLARRWHDEALGSGITAAEAGRNLDGILALFTAAKRFGERRPDGTPAMFLAELLDAEVPEDTLAPRSRDDAVLVTTPAGAIGLEFDTVVVGGLQDGAWPNLRLRGSLLAPHELRLAGEPGWQPSPADERREVLWDELRLLALAVSRACCRVVFAAVANDDESPSPFLGFVPGDAALLPAKHALTLRGQVGMLRREAVAGDPARRAAAASTLGALAAAGVPGADPAQWHGLLPPSSTGPLYEGDPVRISPSKMASIETDPLDWFIDTIGMSESGPIAGIGTLLHAAMEVAEPDVESLWAVVERRWPELHFDAPWIGERYLRVARRYTEALAEYLEHVRLEGKRRAGAESRFELTLDRAVLSGSIDRVEVSPDGAVVIVDLKTGTPPTRAEIAEHPQLLAYQLAYAEGALDQLLVGFGEHHPGGAKLVFVKVPHGGRRYKEGAQPPATPEELAAFRDRIRDVVAAITVDHLEGAAEVPDRGPGMSALRSRLHRVRAVSSD